MQKFTLLVLLTGLSVFAGNDKQQANAYDNAWEDAWVRHCRAIYTAGTGKTAGFVLQIGDSITHSNPYSQWPRYGAGKSSEDSALCAWAQTASMGSGTADTSNKNGFYLAIADTSNRGMTAASGISTAEFLSGSGNGNVAMPSDTSTASAKMKIADSGYNNDIHIDTLAAAFTDAQFAVVMLGTNDANEGRSTSAFIANLTSITDKLEARKIVVILSTIPPMTSSGSASVAPYNAAILGFAQSRGLPVIDFNAEILSRRSGTTWQNTLISGDGVHPSAGFGGYDASSSPYVDGGDAATHRTGPACDNSGYLLRSWLTIQKLKEVKAYVVDGVNPPPTAPVVASIVVTPANSNLPAGSVQQFTAVANDAGGIAVNPQPAFTWSVSNGGGSINALGVVTAATTAGDTYSVTAAASGKSGSASFTIIARSTVGSISVTPALPSIRAGETQALTAIAKDDFGNLLAAQPTFTWAVSGGGSISVSGLLQAGTVAGGPFNVTASASNITGSTFFNIAPLSVVASVVVSPANATVPTLATQQFSALATDQYGNALAPQPPFTWTISGEGSVSSSGLFTATNVSSTATVTASASGILNSASMTISAVNHVPVIESSPAAQPNPAKTGKNIQFTTSASDPDNDLLSYAWNFGDSTSGVGASATHTYNVAGLYTVTATASDASGSTVSSTFTLIVEAPQLIGTGIDRDEDGYSDDLESMAGSSPLNATETPGGAAAGAPPLTLQLQKMGIKLNFRKQGSDSIQISGTLPVPAGFDVAGQSVTVDVGGVLKTFSLGSKGKSLSGIDTFKMKLIAKKRVVPAQHANFLLKLKKGDFAAALADEGLVGTADAKNAMKMVRVDFIFNQNAFRKDLSQFYSAKAGKSGRTTSLP